MLTFFVYSLVYFYTPQFFPYFKILKHRIFVCPCRQLELQSKSAGVGRTLCLMPETLQNILPWNSEGSMAASLQESGHTLDGRRAACFKQRNTPQRLQPRKQAYDFFLVVVVLFFFLFFFFFSLKINILTTMT